MSTKHSLQWALGADIFNVHLFAEKSNVNKIFSVFSIWFLLFEMSNISHKTNLFLCSALSKCKIAIKSIAASVCVRSIAEWGNQTSLMLCSLTAIRYFDHLK